MTEIYPETHDLGTVYFPKGCPYCGSKVKLLPFVDVYGYEVDNAYVYCCGDFPDCNSYVHAHQNDKGDAVLYAPIGRIANEELRSLHEYVRAKFNPLWMNHLIKTVCPEYVVRFEEGLEYYIGEVTDIDRIEKVYVIKDDASKIHKVPLRDIEKIDLRTKSYYWLSQRLGISYDEAKIPMLDEEQSMTAIKVIEQAYKNLNFKVHENNS